MWNKQKIVTNPSKVNTIAPAGIYEEQDQQFESTNRLDKEAEDFVSLIEKQSVVRFQIDHASESKPTLDDFKNVTLEKGVTRNPPGKKADLEPIMSHNSETRRMNPDTSFGGNLHKGCIDYDVPEANSIDEVNAFNAVQENNNRRVGIMKRGFITPEEFEMKNIVQLVKQSIFQLNAGTPYPGDNDSDSGE